MDEKEIKVDVGNRYRHEILDIKNKLQQLEDGRIYDLTKAQMDGYLSTNIVQLRKMIVELLYKIQYSEDSISEELGKAFGNIKL